jgi:uncharacterized protein YbjT (DUF2867 family)
MATPTPIRTVALAGAAGNLGPAILSQLLAANFTVTVLTRQQSSPSAFPPTVKVTPVDYTSLDSLTTALRGQDAVVSTLASRAIDVQTRLIDAALAAGVQRFIPSEFGSDTRNPLARKLPVYADKVKVQEYLVQKAAHSDTFTYTCIFNGAFLDWCLKAGILPGKEMYDGGDRPFSTTRTSTIGKAVVGVLQHPEETRNGYVYVHEAVVTQKQLAGLAGKDAWEAEDVRTAVLEREAYAELGKKEPDFGKAMFGFIKRAVWGEGYGGVFAKADNELLGIEMMSEQELQAVVREYGK